MTAGETFHVPRNKSFFPSAEHMKAIFRGCVLVLTAVYLLAMVPAERDVHVCTCRLHAPDCRCCMASVSDSDHARHALVKCSCDMETGRAKGGAKLSGLCRCKEGKKAYETPSTLAVIRSEAIAKPHEGPPMICRKQGLVLPGYRIPPMKPPPPAPMI